MTNVYTTVQIIKDFEPSPGSGFYVDLDRNKNLILNFGNGLNITSNQDVAINIINQSLLDSGVSQTTIGAVLNLLISYQQNPGQITSVGTGSIIVTQLNDLLSGINLQPIADDATNLFLTQKVVPSLQKALGLTVYNNLPTPVLNGLLDLVYNGGIGKIIGLSSATIPGLLNAIKSGNWGAAAYAVNFDQRAQGGVVSRRDTEAMVMLGFQVGLDGYYNITSLTPVAVNSSQLAQYEQFLVQGNWKITGDIDLTAIQNEVIPYLKQNGYYVPQDNDVSGSDTTENNIAASIVKQLNISGLTTADLEQINAS